jgi:hypothetical protein
MPITLEETHLLDLLESVAIFMNDPGRAITCSFAEGLALEYEDGGDDEDAKNDIEDAEWNLTRVFFGE